LQKSAFKETRALKADFLLYRVIFSPARPVENIEPNAPSCQKGLVRV
jgi:hypothetical protein